MPPRSDRPGLKRGRHNLPYWIAKQVVRDPMGFPDPCIALPPDADDAQLGELCRGYTAELLRWIEERQAEGTDGRRYTRYDGSVRSLCRCYQEHPDSPFHDVKRNTRKFYTDSLKVIEATVGNRAVRRVKTFEVRRWYKNWRAPAEPGGPERIKRAHDAVAAFRMLLGFGAALHHEECAKLDQALAKIRFERGGAREQELTYAHATAFIRTALELERRDVLPAGRGLYMAIGVAAQFELLLRQMDIIGEWSPTSLERRRGQAEPLIFGDDMWSGFFTWERIPGWRWRLKTSKSKYRAAADFDLRNYPLLFPLLEMVPHDQRSGAVVKGEHGLPVRYRSYQKWFRQIARPAGIPDEVWNMDSRAGGATEADEAGVPLEHLRDGMTHSDRDTTLRYIRRRGKKIEDIAAARRARRAAEGGSDGD